MNEYLAKPGSNSSPSDTLLRGMSLVIPLLTPTVLSLPALSRAYMSLTHHILSLHPSQLSRLDPQLFSALISSVVAGIRHHDTDVAGEALSSIRDLGVYHTAARRTVTGAHGAAPSPYSCLDLTPQFTAVPDLFFVLAKEVILCSLGGGDPPTGGTGRTTTSTASSGGGSSVVFATTLLPQASDALLSCIRADAAAFQRAAEAALGGVAGSHGGGLAARMAGELSELTGPVIVDVTGGFSSGSGVEVALTQDCAGGGWKASLVDRKVKALFASRFQTFVQRMRGALTVL